MKLYHLIELIYAEHDFSRSVATAVAGVSGLVAYLWRGDWVVSGFTAVITFSASRVIADALYAGWKSKQHNRTQLEKLNEQFESFSPEERKILEFFVKAGSCCVSWGFVNNSDLPFPRPALNSLMHRGMIHESVMEDGMTESFVLDAKIFDLAQKRIPHEIGRAEGAAPNSCPPRQLPASREIQTPASQSASSSGGCG
jgi:hypothetical protein